MILYFSGTGNSQFVAIQLSEIIADKELVSINQYLKSGKKASFHSKHPLVFVVPTYSWRIPRVVEQWIMDTEFSGDQNSYFILTCGSGCGNASFYAKKLCKEKGLNFCGLSPIVMPENYLAMFPTPNESQCSKIVDDSISYIEALAKQIQSGKHFDAAHISLAGKLESGPINPLFYSLFVHDKGFWVSDNCISCGKCALRCPLNNIDLKNGKPEWNGNCTHCMACISCCPTKAIEYKSKSKGKHRHYIMNDSI